MVRCVRGGVGGRDDGDWMYQRYILVEIDAAEGEFAEGSLLLELGGLFGVLLFPQEKYELADDAFIGS